MPSTADRPAPKAGSWADVLGEGRLPRFILICLGVWLSAADSLVTTTIMPSVGKDLGGYAYFGWATAGFLLGSVIAGASSGLLARRFGVRRGTAVTAMVYALGCALSAAGPDMLTFLLGRALQGLGGGWVMGFCSVAIGVMFPDRTLTRVYASSTAIWGVATLVGPMLGGLFAGLSADGWRWLFWFFAIQGAAVGLAALKLLPKGENGDEGAGVAWPQLAMITLGVAAIGIADMTGQPLQAAGLIVVGLGILLFAVAYDGRATTRLLPIGSSNPSSLVGGGYATLFLTTAASMGFSVYGPAILQTLFGYSALSAGYVIAIEAMAWTVAGLMVANLTGPWPDRMILLGTVCVAVSMAICIAAFPSGSTVAVLLAGAILGAGFGLSFAFTSRKILASLAEDERGIGAAGMTTVRLTGSAAGAAAAACVANLLGFSKGLSVDTANAVAVWVFVAALPVAGLGVLTAWRFARH